MKGKQNKRWETLGFRDLGIDNLYSLLSFRQRIFVVEQECPYEDLDGVDQSSDHIMCFDGSDIIAYSRSSPPATGSNSSALSRIAVCHLNRNAGLGRELLKKSIDFNFAKWPDSQICISAQTYLIEFYQSLGFLSVGSDYQEDGIPHIKMVLALTKY